MKTTLRKIGNSRGVLIPAALLAACDIRDEIDLRVEGRSIVIAPVSAPRAHWFDGYRAEADTSGWPAEAVTSADEDWQW